MVQQFDRSSRSLARLTVAAVSAIALGLGSCTPSSETAGEASSADAQVAADEPTASDTEDDSLDVVTTFLPITNFTQAVAGDRADVVQLLPLNVGPHDYQAKPADVQAIANADVLVQNGVGMEFFLDDLIANADNSELVVIDSSEGISTLASAHEEHSPSESIDAEHGHQHGHEHDHEHEHDHPDADTDAQADAGDHGHSHGEFNPHIWLDPQRAIEQVENIRDGLIAADPQGEADYTANAAAYIEQLQALDAEIADQLAPFAGRTFVVFHDFAPYFAERYNLQAEAFVGIPEENPSPDDVKRVMDAVRAEGLKTILTEPQAEASTFQAIANDLEVNVSQFDPIATGSPEATDPDYYLTVMRQNADNLVIAFEASAQSWVPLMRPAPVVAGLVLASR